MLSLVSQSMSNYVIHLLLTFESIIALLNIDVFTIADIAIWPWVHALFEVYDNAGEVVFNLRMLYPNVLRWYSRCMGRPATKRSLEVCKLNMDST